MVERIERIVVAPLIQTYMTQQFKYVLYPVRQ
jgi:hypothetical protein